MPNFTLKWTPPKITHQQAVLKNTADYATDVHFGDVRKDGTEKPARPWMDTAIAETDLIQILKASFNATGNFDRAFVETATELHDAMKELILDERWEWDRPTRRHNGQIVESPRDIYDTGNLYRSQELDFE